MNSITLKKASLVIALAASGLVLAATVAVAQNNQSHLMSLFINREGFVQLTGTVSAVSGSVISVSSWGGTWTVNASQATILPADMPNGLLGIKAGDTVKIQGAVTGGMSIAAERVLDKTFSQSFKRLSGTISNLNTNSNTFTLATRNEGNVQVTANSAAVITVNGAAATFASLFNGMTVMVSGSFDDTLNSITALKIAVLPPVKAKKEKNDNHAMLKNILSLY